MADSNESLWISTSGVARFPSLDGDLQVDVVIVGAGITGITAAKLLVDQGLRVAMLEMHRVVGGETGHTTAHLTELVDARYHGVEKDFGKDAAAKVAESSRLAIER